MPEKSILVIEDEPSIAEVVSLYLRRAGYQVETIDDGKLALESLQKGIPDLVVMDLMLPNVDGYTLTRWLRDRSEVPIIMLTSRRAEMDRINGLETGADDYVVKPFSPQELVSRVRAVLRRTRGDGPSENQQALEFDDLKIEPFSREVHVRGQRIEMTMKEFDLLNLFTRHPRQVFTREHLLERVCFTSDYIDPGTVTVHIRRLREKIEKDPSRPQHLVTIWGVGYKFEP